jgi:pyridoxal phosphate enzyme (YggS family)
MAMTYDVAAALDALRGRIEDACARAGRKSSEITLVAVSKAHPGEAVRAAHAAGLRVFGENYAQELANKAEALSDLDDVRWRFIGHLQRNKIKLVERARASVDTVDSIRLAEALSSHAAARSMEVEVLLQVNVGEEAQKSGCAPREVGSLVQAVRSLPNLDLRGLMTVAPHYEQPDDARAVFAALRDLAAANSLRELSMGMTHDLEAAVLEGTTMLRIGTALFGPRPKD